MTQRPRSSRSLDRVLHAIDEELAGNEDDISKLYSTDAHVNYWEGDSKDSEVESLFEGLTGSAEESSSPSTALLKVPHYGSNSFWFSPSLEPTNAGKMLKDLVRKARESTDTQLEPVGDEIQGGLLDARRISELLASTGVTGEGDERLAIDINYLQHRLASMMYRKAAESWLMSHNFGLGSRPVDALATRKFAELVRALDSQEQLAYA